MVALTVVATGAPRAAGAAGGIALAPGAWELREYGVRAVVHEDDSVTEYQVTRTRCREVGRMPGGEAAARWGLGSRDVAPAAGGGVRATRGISRYTWNPVPADRLACPTPPVEVTSTEVFNALDELFNDHYAFFKLHGVDRDGLARSLMARAAQAANDEELFAVCRDYLAPLKDAHVTLEGAGQRFKAGSPPPDAPDPDGLVPRRAPLIAAYRTWLPDQVRSRIVHADSAVGGLVRWGVVEGDGARVGYLYVQAMEGLVQGEAAASATWRDQVQAMDEALDRAIPAFAGARGVIVDLRFNGGGEDAVAMALVGRFAQGRVLAFTKQAYWQGARGAAYDVFVEPSSRPRFDGKVAVLAGPLTASAAEIAVLGFRALPRTRVFGLPTMGVLSDALEKTLPNGWTVTLSNEIYRAADGELYEGRGIPPHLKSPTGTPRTIDERFGTDLRVAAGWIRN